MRLVYLSPVPWASFAQRPHKFVDWFHLKHAAEVLWVNPYPARLPQLADFQRMKGLRRGTPGLSVSSGVPAWLTVLYPRAMPIEPLPGISLLNRVLWKGVMHAIDQFIARGQCQIAIAKPSALALQLLSRHSDVSSLFDAMDDFPAFHSGLSRRAMEKREQEIASCVTQILVSSSALADRFGAHKSKLTLALNACAIETLPPPRLLAQIRVQPVLGYVGTIGHWFDWRLVFALAEAHPSLSIRLIGPMYAGPPGPLPPNIELLPACSHTAAIQAMQEFSVGLIPFKLNDLTASVDPIKYYEYRALGLPVLSTRFGEMALRREEAGVFLIDEREDLVELVKKAMAFESTLFEMGNFRAQNSWNARFDASCVSYAA
jgi:hypothetical protein